MVFKDEKKTHKEREKVLKQTRMQRHEEKIRATIKRNKKIITLTTLVSLVCPATLGTIQALADETAPPVEQTAEPVTEPVTPEQPTETPSQEPVTPEAIETVTPEPEQTTTIEEVAPTQAQPIDQTTTPVANMSVTEQAEPRAVPGNEPAQIAKLQENWNKYIGLNQSDYTPESWAETGIGEQGWIGGYSPILLADPEMEVPLYSASLINQWWDWAFSKLVEKSEIVVNWSNLEGAMARFDALSNQRQQYITSNPLKAEQIQGWKEIFANHSLVEVNENAQSMLDQYASLLNGYVDDAISNMPEEEVLDFSALDETVARYHALSQARKDWIETAYDTNKLAQIKVAIEISADHSILENNNQPDNQAVIDYNTFILSGAIDDAIANVPEIPLVISSELVGPTEVETGKTYKYSIKLTREDGTVAYEDIEGAAFVLLGLDSSDEIDGEGNVTFGNAGTRTFSGQNFTGLTVTVKEASQPSETVNYIIKCVDAFGNPFPSVPDVTKSAKKGTSVTETAPEITGYTVLNNENTQTKVIGDNTIFTFMYKKNKVLIDWYMELSGDSTARVGESKTYQIRDIMHYNDGSIEKTLYNFEDYPHGYNTLVSSDPSDLIVNGTVTFGSEGSRILEIEGTGFTMEVTVTKDSQEKTLTGIGFIPVIGMGVDGKLVPWSDFRVNLYYSDSSQDVVIPNATDYAFSTDNPNDVVTADGIIFNGIGPRVITVTHKGFTDKNGFVVVADQGLKEDDLKEAIKNGEDKISQEGWETTKDLEDAISKGKEILADDNRTQEDIDNTTKNINDAINALKKKDDGNSGNSGGNGNNSNNGANSNTGNNSSNKTNTTNVSNKSNQASHNSSNKDNLPQTGDTTSNSLLAGLSMVGLTAMAWIKKRRKA